MWIALTILFALLSFVLYMANRELDETIKVQEDIIQILFKRNDEDDNEQTRVLFKSYRRIE